MEEIAALLFTLFTYTAKFGAGVRARTNLSKQSTQVKINKINVGTIINTVLTYCNNGRTNIIVLFFLLRFKQDRCIDN